MPGRSSVGKPDSFGVWGFLIFSPLNDDMSFSRYFIFIYVYFIYSCDLVMLSLGSFSGGWMVLMFCDEQGSESRSKDC